MPDIGGRTAEIAATEARLGRVLPPSVREWVAFAHDVRREEDFHVVFRDSYMMEDVPGHAALSLLMQAEGDIHWAVNHADFGHDDPLVTEYFGGAAIESGEFTPTPGDKVTVTQFAFDYALGYADGEGGSFATDIRDTAPLIKNLSGTFPFVAEIGTTSLFEMDDILAVFYRWNKRRYLKVRVRRPVPREAIPDFLWPYTTTGGSFSGMFIVQRGDRPPPGGPLPGGEIPF